MLHFTAVNGKRNIRARDDELIGTRVSPEVKASFQLVAESQNRSVAGELRHMIEARVRQFEAESEKAAA